MFRRSRAPKATPQSRAEIGGLLLGHVPALLSPQSIEETCRRSQPNTVAAQRHHASFRSSVLLPFFSLLYGSAGCCGRPCCQVHVALAGRKGPGLPWSLELKLPSRNRGAALEGGGCLGEAGHLVPGPQPEASWAWVRGERESQVLGRKSE